MLLGMGAAYSQENRTEVFVDFRVNRTQIELEYKDNASRISKLINFLQHVQADSTVDIVDVTFCGAASPEGSYEWNRKLAKGRMESLEKLIRSKVEIPDSLISYDDSYIPWDHLAQQIARSNLPRKQLILDILDDEPRLVKYYNGFTIDNRVIRLRRLGRKSWNLLLREYFGPMRNACMVYVKIKHRPASVVTLEPATKPTKEIVEPERNILDSVPEPLIVSTPGWGRKLYVKTNALGLGMAIANAAVEIDLCKHWSFHLPVYYSAWDYFSETIKFRTLAIQPELRYWFSEKNHCNDGLFVGAHFGLAYYNIATDGEYRTQDHDGTSPALGGGLAVGYRLPVSKNNRWKMEFSIGAGAYSLHYDKFRNHNNGMLIDTEKKTYFGIDQASISLSYTFNLKRKGGAK